MQRCRILCGCLLAALCLLSGGARAQVITEFDAGISLDAGPRGITAGPDGNLWFTEDNAYSRIGRITPLGVITEFSAGISFGAGVYSITAGPDGNLWFTEQDNSKVGRITPLGVVTEFNTGIVYGSSPRSITAGPDGNLWFTEVYGNRIGRITPLGVVTEFSAGITAGAFLEGITAGPDGNLWFAEFAGNRIGRITPLGVVTEFSAGISAGAGPTGITAGPDGNLWFTEQFGHRIGRITPSGVVTEFDVDPGSRPHGITPGPDGNLWFTEQLRNGIGRITPLGVVTEFRSGLRNGATPADITAGPDGNLWFAEFVGAIGRITVPGSPPTITSASSTSFTAGVFGTFTVTTTGTPAISKTGALPGGVTFVDNGNGTATLSGTASAAGIFPLTITASNGVLPDATQSFTLTVSAVLTYTPVTPCRLVDTRVAVGAFAARSGRNYAASDSTRIGQAGGNPAGCNIPVGPEALALTLTAVLPPQVGNLVAYPAGGAVPLASALNFLPGQIIANTTFVPITPGAGDNFSVFNNSDGTTPVVVDVVGYFWEYLSADCSKASQSLTAGAGGTIDVPATCSSGYVPVGGGCSTDTAGASSWLSRGATVAGDGYHCTMLNSSAGSVTVTADTMCCRRAGR